MIPVRVGNDVVDLSDPRTDRKSCHTRFVERVFDADEQRELLAADDPDLDLWCRWAAKEAGYKVVSKLLPSPPPFVHRDFRVSWTVVRPSVAGPPMGTPVREGAVHYREFDVRVWVSALDSSVHAVAVAGPAADPPDRGTLRPTVARLDTPGSVWSGAEAQLRSRLTPRELEAVRSRQSAAVRLGARSDLAQRLRVTEARLEIVCATVDALRRPPQVLLDGAPAAADVSLSHDGSWIAWATWVAEPTEDG